VRTETLEDDRVPQIYSSVYQAGSKHPPKHLAVFLRGHLDTGTIPDALRAQIQAVDPTIPVFGAQTLGETVSASLAQRRFSMQMVSLFALSALLLAGIGIYGVISYIVGERTAEIGIRLALGADKKSILLTIVRDGFGLALSGAVIGTAGAVITSHLMTGMLYGVRATDPLAFAVVAVVLIGVALLACCIPARRAIQLDPMIALRRG
jgi:putative ABC transport system permease protein